uniref:Cystatin-B n=2 Tax=Poecilia formosa TaxID=48698 RepID=A0A096M4F2_POEFO
MSEGNMLGAWSETKPAGGDFTMLTSWLRYISEETTKRKFNEFKPIEYKEQLVHGKNYVIKVQVGENDYVLLQVFQSFPLGNKVETKFEGVQDDHKRDDPLKPF